MSDTDNKLTVLEDRILQDMESSANVINTKFDWLLVTILVICSTILIGLLSRSPFLGALVFCVEVGVCCWLDYKILERAKQGRINLVNLCRDPSARPVIISGMQKLRNIQQLENELHQLGNNSNAPSVVPHRSLLAGSVYETITEALR